MASKAAQQPSTILRAITLPFRYVAWSLGFMMVSQLICWCSVLLYYGTTPPLDGLRGLYHRELEQLTGLWLPPTVIHDALNAVHTVYFRWLPIEPFIQTHPDQLSSWVQSIQAILVAHIGLLNAWGLACKLWMIRSVALIQMMPMVALGYGLGYVEGHYFRRLRRSGGARESSSQYHLAKYALMGLLGGGCLMYWLLPITIPLVPLTFCISFCVAILSAWQWTYLRKYL